MCGRQSRVRVCVRCPALGVAARSGGRAVSPPGVRRRGRARQDPRPAVKAAAPGAAAAPVPCVLLVLVPGTAPATARGAEPRGCSLTCAAPTPTALPNLISLRCCPTRPIYPQAPLRGEYRG
ncbi:hypothetical protein Nmel_016446 [Mimus melanotis]